VISLHGEVLPLVDLKAVFGTSPGKTAEPADGRKKRPVIVVSHRETKIGLIVDRIVGTDDIVVKPIEKNYKALKGVSGASILGDGRIALVLDIPGVAGLCGGTAADSDPRPAVPQTSLPEPGSAAVSPVSPAPAVGVPNPSPLTGWNGLLEESFANAARRLSELTGRPMSLHCGAGISLLSPEEFINKCGEELEHPYFGSLIRTDKGPALSMLLLVPKDDGSKFYELLTGFEGADETDILTAVGEMNNIMGSSLINLMANHTGREIHPAVPVNSQDMLGALMQAAVLQEEFLDKKVLCADTVIAEPDGRSLRTRMVAFADRDAMEKFIENRAA
jgi:chemotaxis protein CheY-P-specific phosphatase CheC